MYSALAGACKESIAKKREKNNLKPYQLRREVRKVKKELIKKIDTAIEKTASDIAEEKINRDFLADTIMALATLIEARAKVDKQAIN